MTLPNIHFEGFPIEFKEINPEDFPQFEVENNREKVIIEPNREGYINNVFQNKINLTHKNTVVVNAAVGQGKSTAIINTIKRYYIECPKTLIIVASPFVSLVEQYCSDINTKAEIPEDDIYNYSNLGRNNTIEYTTRRVQVVTVNTLLGNPGEDGFKNSDIKRKYLNDLIEYCQSNAVKVVFIYDEIHDAIQNFKEEFIFNLWKWKDVVLKNYILSATYNEASKIVIEYLAELTDRKIQIIESKRVLFPEKQSKLFLHYSPAYNFKSNTPELIDVVKTLIAADKSIDILCYSKTLAKSIIKDNDGIGRLLKEKFEEINDCTSELVSNQRALNEAPTNRFDNEKCNVGTNFKTGVSITKRNHAFIIIMPPRASKLWFRNKDGIFSGGINSVVQALARQRTVGEIHIILSKPDWFDYISLQHAGLDMEQSIAFAQTYDLVKHYRRDEKLVQYFPLSIQDYLVLLFYKEKLHYNVADEISYINTLERDGLPTLKFPEYKTFKLNRGEDYIASSFKFFGEDIASYLTYCAFTNQFVNCKLQGITYKTTLFFREGQIQQQLNNYFNQYFSEDYYYSRILSSNFHMAYIDFRNELFSGFSIKYQKEGASSYETTNPYSNKYFEIQLLRFVALKYYGVKYFYNEELTELIADIPYRRSSYFLDSVKLCQNINLQTTEYSENAKQKVRFFQIVNHFRDKLIHSIQYYESSSSQYFFLYNNPPRNFWTGEDLTLFDEAKALIQADPLLQNDIFSFRRELNLKSFYNKLVEDFFEFTSERHSTGSRPNIKKITSIKLLPLDCNVIDLVVPAQYDLYEPEAGSEDYNYFVNRDMETISSMLPTQE